MKNVSPNKGSAAGRHSKLRPSAKATTKTTNQGTERKETPAQILKDSEVRYRRLFEAAQDGILILDAQTGAIDDVNPYLIDLLGYSHAEFVKKKLWEVGAFKDIDASKIAFNLLQEHRYIRYKNLPLRTKSGQLIQVEFVSNVYLADGRDIIQCNIRDATDRSQIEEAFRVTERLYRSLFDNMLNGITYCKMIFEQGQPLDFIYLDVNSIFESLIGLKDVVGKKASEVLSGIRESDPGLIELFGRVALTGKPERCETYVEALKMWFSISVYALEQDYFVAEYDTITERKQAEEEIILLNKQLEQRVIERTRQLEFANEELEAFSYSISHDLRAPLRGIDGWSLALLEDYSGLLDEQGQEYIRRVRSETSRMGELIDALLQLSRVTRAEIHSERVDLSAVARSIVARLQEGESQRRVEFIIQNGLSAIGDANLLEVMLTNLLSNAFKFTGRIAEARIEIGLMDKDDQRVFFVRDNGAGFDMAYAKNLFGAFQRMHKASEFPGTGIGLATVQRIINRHGGRVWAESAVNEGATFFFTLKASL